MDASLILTVSQLSSIQLCIEHNVYYYATNVQYIVYRTSVYSPNDEISYTAT